jgi:hypothetical protein
VKKKMGLFLFAFALVTTALVSTPAVAGPSLLCPPGAFSCYIGPVCCADQHCAAFCEDKGGNPHCSGNASEKGCCSCGVEEIEG